MGLNEWAIHGLSPGCLSIQTKNMTPGELGHRVQSMPLLHSPAPSLSSSPSISHFKNAGKRKLRCFVAVTTASSNGSNSLSSSVGSPPSIPISGLNLGRNHVLLLGATACAAAISTCWLFFSVIPSLLAFKKAAESMEKLLDVTAQELPDNMAAVRLSGMEISQLTMELSDIGQELTQGVRSATRAVRVAEDGLRRVATMASTVPMQRQAPPRNETEGPLLARTARNAREGIVKGRSLLGVIFSITQFSRLALNFLASRQQKRTL